jgi:hypothetical protein
MVAREEPLIQETWDSTGTRFTGVEEMVVMEA